MEDAKEELKKYISKLENKLPESVRKSLLADFCIEDIDNAAIVAGTDSIYQVLLADEKEESNRSIVFQFDGEYSNVGYMEIVRSGNDHAVIVRKKELKVINNTYELTKSGFDKQITANQEASNIKYNANEEKIVETYDLTGKLISKTAGIVGIRNGHSEQDLKTLLNEKPGTPIINMKEISIPLENLEHTRSM